MAINKGEVVIFRVWKFKPKNVIAFWPNSLNPYNGFCISYEHVGQHGGANYTGCIKQTRPAKKSEYTYLLKELKRQGYKPIVRKRA